MAKRDIVNAQAAAMATAALIVSAIAVAAIAPEIATAAAFWEAAAVVGGRGSDAAAGPAQAGVRPATAHATAA